MGGVIPTDLSDLTDTTNLIKTDVSQLADATNLIATNIGDLLPGGNLSDVLTKSATGYAWTAPVTETFSLATMKNEVANSTDFADFKTRIAAL